ncbi:hypothetical protein DPMN_109922 [Dreissena polymorpha]|uniref:Uncharacterized protein n=1 Tax=Dreissena polymorpha TaxID=45954 RepID=A0A9D4QNH8_DREPO|nr:hypothetical protein DPMN_109922 [Dreissena polymorpha]
MAWNGCDVSEVIDTYFQIVLRQSVYLCMNLHRNAKFGNKVIDKCFCYCFRKLIGKSNCLCPSGKTIRNYKGRTKNHHWYEEEGQRYQEPLVRKLQVREQSQAGTWRALTAFLLHMNIIQSRTSPWRTLSQANRKFAEPLPAFCQCQGELMRGYCA